MEKKMTFCTKRMGNIALHYFRTECFFILSRKQKKKR